MGTIMKKQFALAALAAAYLAGCTTTDPYTGQQKISNTAGGAAIGALAGAGAGLLAGGDDRKNALIGAGVGALVGGGVGVFMDKQEAELRAQLQGTGVSVSRVGDQIVLNMPSNITFATDQDQVNTGFYPTLNSVGLVLNKYKQSLVDIYGHTDSQGRDDYNLDLSQRRAQSVAGYLTSQGVDSRRFYVQGAGETQPVASNNNEAGRSQNRRVEIKISPLS
jgi:outer membrane protein OmpA-like peptidoglycan-associated protein